MFRRFRDVPPRLKAVWAISWATLLLVVGLGVWSSAQFLLGRALVPTPAASAPWFLVAALGITSALFRSYVGDAAVYLSPTPANIEARQKIRAAGLDLLEKVMSSGRYDRIIVVGHSLGSVIGYDVLNLAWQKHFDAVRTGLSAAWLRGERLRSRIPRSVPRRPWRRGSVTTTTPIPPHSSGLRANGEPPRERLPLSTRATALRGP